MLPGQALSLSVLSAGFLAPRDQRGITDYLIDYEMGGVDIGDASQGLQVKTWTGQVIGNDVVLSADSVTPVTVLTVPGITEFGFTFDQNMRVFVAYVVGGNTFFYWYDSTITAYTTTQLPSGSKCPRCSLDDKRPLEALSSDIILVYLRAGSMYFRAQRDRYGVEYLLTNAVAGKLLAQVGMNSVNRFQFFLRAQ